ncbi:sugar and carbohydrate transporter [Serinicoccus hydrothermalis]|uniref:Sugar and carbohydrate transporter n=1 Tax=Serinicoccus hydrothermalis TaxID=1758689 RepID=A0A1B1N818_9MICO|nr:sugar porter family MFS transporter [Serinicoccus hydrothermalis]ANS77569.1 sugar and carbohydrate transporter [Serinicoccus hydrothermalis]
MQPLVIRSAIIAALGGLLFGFDTAVISGTTSNLTEVFDLNGFELGFTVATALIGTVVGAAYAGLGKPADRYGRKPVLIVIGVLYVVSALGSALATDWITFMVFRFVGGLGVGAATAVAPIYNAEVAPPRHRGRLVGLFQFNIVLGILLAYLSNFAILGLFPEETAWRWMFGAEALPALVFALLVFFIPESPRWLMAVGRDDEARTIIDQLTSDETEARTQREEIKEALESEGDSAHVPFFTSGHRKVILLAFAIAAFNQLGGINAVLYYAPSIFESAGLEESAAFLNSAGVGLVNLVATVLALTLIDRVGRKFLMYVCSAGYLVTLGLLTVLFFLYEGDFSGVTSGLVVASIMLFVGVHAFGQGAVIWVFISEIFPNAIRARGQSFGALTHWTFAAAISWTFPAIASGLGAAFAFGLFFLGGVAMTVWTITVMPETKGIPLEEMQEKLDLVGSAAMKEQ